MSHITARPLRNIHAPSLTGERNLQPALRLLRLARSTARLCLAQNSRRGFAPQTTYSGRRDGTIGSRRNTMDSATSGGLA